MILRDTELRGLVERGAVAPVDDPAVQIQPASIDLRLHEQFVTFPRRPAAPIRTDALHVPAACMHTVRAPGGLDLAPGEFCLAQTIEYVRIPPDFAARVEGRSSLGRLGLAVHITAGFIDPGFEGRITLELHNVGFATLRLVPGTRISQIVFHRMSGPAELPYGLRRGSKYQGQSSPEPARPDGQ